MKEEEKIIGEKGRERKREKKEKIGKKKEH